MIVAFQYPHKIGSVCLTPCGQCDEKPGELGYMIGIHGEVEPPAMLILRTATYSEYLEYRAECGSELPPVPEGSAYFYEISAD